MAFSFLCFSRLIATCKEEIALLKPGIAKGALRKLNKKIARAPQEFRLSFFASQNKQAQKKASKFRGAAFCNSRRGRYTAPMSRIIFLWFVVAAQRTGRLDLIGIRGLSRPEVTERPDFTDKRT
jgi:hypothetical protein